MTRTERIDVLLRKIASEQHHRGPNCPGSTCRESDLIDAVLLVAEALALQVQP
jgi:hypothetical protein